MAHSGALWVPFPSILSCPLSLFVLFPFRAAVQCWCDGGAGRGVWSWLEPSCAWSSFNMQSAGVSSSLTPFAHCPRAAPSLCLSSGEKVDVRRWEQSRTSALVEVGLGCLGGSTGTGGIQSTQVRQGHMGIALQLPHWVTWWHCCGWKTEVSASLCPAPSFYFVLLCAALDSSGVQIRHISGFHWTAQ